MIKIAYISIAKPKMSNKQLNSWSVFFLMMSIIAAITGYHYAQKQESAYFAKMDEFMAYQGLLNKSFLKNPNITGIWNSRTDNILIIGGGRHSRDLRETFEHENCHRIYWTLLSESQRIEYQKIYYKTDSFISEYAKANEQEDFAENCAHYILKTKPLLKINEAFMDSHVREFIK